MDHDHFLIKQIKHKDNYSAFEEIFNKYYDPLKSWSNYILGSHQLAEEAVLDVFFKLWNNRKKVEINTSLKSYLFTSVKNQSVDYLRRDIQKQTTEQSVDIKGEFNQPDDIMELMELKTRIDNAVDELPDQCRKIFRMSRDEGMKYKEIAESLSISVKTVETQIGRALIKLKRIIYGNKA